MVLSGLPRAFRWQEAVAAGMTQHQIRIALQHGAISRLSRGVYARPAAIEPGEPWEMVRTEHLRRCADLLIQHPGHAASHQTAAIVHGLDLAVHPEMDVHLTAVERAPRTQRYVGAQLHHADSLENDTVIVDGLRATTIARTLTDVLRTSRPPHSVAVLDGAVRDRRVTAMAVKAVLDRQVRWRGRPRAVEAFALHDPRRESWLESYSFVGLHQHGIPMPLAQVEVLDQGFHLVGRVDGLIEETGTFLEADGAGKYLLPAREQGREVPPPRARARHERPGVDRADHEGAAGAARPAAVAVPHRREVDDAGDPTLTGDGGRSRQGGDARG